MGPRLATVMARNLIGGERGKFRLSAYAATAVTHVASPQASNEVDLAVGYDEEPIAAFASRPREDDGLEVEMAPAVGTESTGVGLALGGAVLVVGGMAAACHALGLALHHGVGWSAAPLWALAGGCGLGLGLGSIGARRWAAPLIHACGWVIVLSALFYMAAGTAALFYAAQSSMDEAPPPWALFVGLGVLGVVMPLIFITYYQRDAVARFCAVADPRTRWTDPRPIPGLMACVCGLAGVGAVLGAIWGEVDFPMIGGWWTGEQGSGAWFGSLALFSLALGGCMTGARWGWWLLTGLIVLGLSLVMASPSHRLLDGPGRGMDYRWLVLTLVAPIGLVLLMSRREFGEGSAEPMESAPSS
jgi:hypothetical protein